MAKAPCIQFTDKANTHHLSSISRSLPQMYVRQYGAANCTRICPMSIANLQALTRHLLATGRHYHWQKGGGAVIVNGIDAAHLKNGILPHMPTATLVAA